MQGRRWLAAAVACGLVLAACGSDDDAADSTSAATPPGGAATTAVSDATSSPGTSGPAASEPGTTDEAGPTTPDEPASGDPYKIGYIGILSGPIAALGQAFQAGMDAYIADRNAHGGVGGRPIELVAADDRNDPATGIAAYRNMVTSDKVLGVFGLIGSNVATGVQNVANDLKTPIVGVGVIPPAEGFSFVAGLNPLQTMPDEVALVEHLMQDAGIDNPKIAVIGSDSVSGHASNELLAEMAPEKGFELSDAYYLVPGMTQFSTEAAEIQRFGPDVVMVTTTSGAMSIVQRALRQAGVEAPIINYWAGASEQLMQELNDPNFYVYRDFSDPAEDSAASMRDAATAQGVDDGTDFSQGNYYTEGYVMAMLAASVLEECGEDCTPETFRDALETDASHIDTDGLSGAVGFSPDDHVFVDEVRYFRWDAEQGRSIPVEGLETAPATG